MARPKVLELDFKQTTAAEVKALETSVDEFLAEKKGMKFAISDLMAYLREKRHRNELIRKYCSDWFEVVAAKRTAINKSIFSACD